MLTICRWKPEGSYHSEDLDLDGINIGMDLMVKAVHWMNLGEKRPQFWAFLKTAMNVRFP
jgi:hypothetical protein